MTTKTKSYRKEVLEFSDAIEISLAKRQRTKLFADCLRMTFAVFNPVKIFCGGTNDNVKVKPRL